MSAVIHFHVNGRRVEAPASQELSLLDYLREDLGLSGTRLCCGIGVCKACTVAARRVEGAAAQPLLACSTPVGVLAGQYLNTIEGVGSPERLSPVQQAFLDHFAFQCGYCTPGFVMATEMLLERLRMQAIAEAELDAAIAEAVGQHVCRCTGYARYHAAIRAVIRTEGLLR
jgi:aerobic-type carbon monoxide dehydrogenase small subunit (CoxS/CutS family)